MVVSRWWDQHNSLPWPDEIALVLRQIINGPDPEEETKDQITEDQEEKKDQRSKDQRMVRRAIMRYCMLSYILALRR